MSRCREPEEACQLLYIKRTFLLIQSKEETVGLNHTNTPLALQKKLHSNPIAAAGALLSRIAPWDDTAVIDCRPHPSKRAVLLLQKQ